MKTDDLRINQVSESLDRRRKLNDLDRSNIKLAYERGVSINGISRQFKVNKRLIQFILFPERKELNLQHRKDRGGWKQYYDKEKWQKTMAEHRDYKRKVMAMGGKEILK